MDLRQLEYFVAVAEELNFTRAAARCHVVQSALSYQIGRLEREHRLPLFERTSRSVRLAPAGDVLLPRARQLLADLDLARSELAALAGVVTGRLRLGMVGSASQAAPMVELTLADFHRRHPAVEITIEDTGSRHMADQVRTGVLDAAFVGLFADQEIKLLQGPIFAGEDYELEREVVALSGSRRTESLWLRTSVFGSKSASPIATMLLNLATIKESYAPYAKEHDQLYS